MKRVLTLRSESLTELTAEELVAVNGAALPVPRTLNLQECTGGLFTHHSALDCVTRDNCG